jgi:hypothetical protein
MVLDPRPHVLVAGAGEQGGAQLGVAAHLRPLAVGKRARLGQHVRRELLLAHVSHERGQAHPLDLVGRQPQLARHPLGQRVAVGPRARPVDLGPQVAALTPAAVADEHEAQVSEVAVIARSRRVGPRVRARRGHGPLGFGAAEPADEPGSPDMDWSCTPRG